MAKKTSRGVAHDVDGPFHVVKHSYNDKYTTHLIYADNEPYLRPAEGTKLSRREAIWIANTLNAKLIRVAKAA